MKKLTLVVPEETGGLKSFMRPNTQVYRRWSKELTDADAWVKQELLADADMWENAYEEICHTEENKVIFRGLKAKFARFYRELASRPPDTTAPVVVSSHAARPRDTPEKRLTAEGMEMKADGSGWLLCPQARHFAMLALDHYNSFKMAHKFELGRVLLSKCFSEADGTTFGHVNFTVIPKDSAIITKRLFFSELMLIPDLQAYEGAEPMRVLHVCTIDDDSCFGGCHELEREEIKKPVRKNLDYDHCHACSGRIKHPRGDQFNGGHDRTRMPYFSANVWTWK
jgi:hypothetical protein